MAYTINENCVACDTCRPLCPTGAIQVEGDKYIIDADLCNGCTGYYDAPQCIIACPMSSPVPLQAKKGRNKLESRPATSPDLFGNGVNNSFASAIAIWEACNILSQRESLNWTTDDKNQLVYQRPVNRGKGAIAFHLIDHLTGKPATTATPLETLDLRAASLHLIYAAHATSLEKPWEQDIIISDRQIEEYLGLEKRKDLSKVAKLALIKDLAQQPCRITASINWPQQGKVKGFMIEDSPLWHLKDIQHHFQEDERNCKHLVGLTFTIRAGIWSKYFLNKQGCKEQTSFYQYGILSKSLLNAVTSIWQQHEGAVRMLLWLLFKTKMGKEQRITVPTLMRIAYGEDKLLAAYSQREERKRLLRTFEGDLEVLNYYGLKPVFDPITYSSQIQPLWAKSIDIPEDPEAAMEFWITDGSRDNRLTDSAPRGKWNLLMNARILWFELPPDWEQKVTKPEKKKTRTAPKRIKPKTLIELKGQQIIEARKNLRLSQRDLAQMAGKSQSWIRDIENGRLRVKSEDQEILRKVLGLSESN